MKITINSIYNDSLNLFEDNDFLNNDDRLEDFADLFADMDLITSNSYGTRELLHNMLVCNNGEYSYNIFNVHRAIYSTFVENLTRYKLLLKADEKIANFDPLVQYREVVTNGEKVRTDEYDSRVDTTTHGDKEVTNVIGSSTDTNTAGAREVEQSVTSFSNDTYKPTSKTEEPQTTDTVVYGTHTDVQTTEHENDTLTHGAHTDTFTEEEHEVTKEGYKDGGKEIERLRTYATQNTLKEIINDCVNHISYGMYLF